MAISKEQMIATIEKSSSVKEAIAELGISQQAVNKRLQRYGLKIAIVTKKSLKVVERESK